MFSLSNALQDRLYSLFEGLYALGDPSRWSRQIFPSWGLGASCDFWCKNLVFNRSGHTGNTGHTSITYCLAIWLKQTMTTMNARVDWRVTNTMPWLCALACFFLQRNEVVFLFHILFRLQDVWISVQLRFLVANWGGVLFLASAAWLPWSFTASGWYRESQESTWCHFAMAWFHMFLFLCLIFAVQLLVFHGPGSQFAGDLWTFGKALLCPIMHPIRSSTPRLWQGCES